VAIADFPDRKHVEGVSQCVSHHDGARARRYRRLDRADVDIVGWNVRVDENGNHIGLQNGIDCRRKPVAQVITSSPGFN